LFASNAIAMANHTLFAVYDKQLRILKNLTTNLLGEEILKPHVVIPSEIVYLDPFAAKFIEPIEEFEIALRHHILVFEPKVEHIAQQEKMLNFILHLAKELHHQFLPKAAIVISGNSEMHIGEKACIALDCNRILKGFHLCNF
jgi:hypothetical protein